MGWHLKGFFNSAELVPDEENILTDKNEIIGEEKSPSKSFPLKMRSFGSGNMTRGGRDGTTTVSNNKNSMSIFEYSDRRQEFD
jgi:hypothetical protein